MDDVLKRLARALAEREGQGAAFDACANDPATERDTGTMGRYLNEAEHLLRRSGLAADLSHTQERPWP